MICETSAWRFFIRSVRELLFMNKLSLMEMHYNNNVLYEREVVRSAYIIHEQVHPGCIISIPLL